MFHSREETMTQADYDPQKVGISQAEINFLVEKNADGILVVDESGLVLFANPAAEQIFGRRLDDLIGTAVGIPAIGGETAEVLVLRPGGEKAEAEIRVVETSWENKPAWLASIRDVSDRRLVEERLRHAAKMEAIGRLTAGIAHDFNNLLTVIIGNLERMQRHGEGMDEALRGAAENAMAGAQRAAALTQKLLAFARRQPLEPKPINVNDLVAGMSELISRTLGERIEVRALPGEFLHLTHADPTELEAVLLNLAVNARDAMPNGGQLTIETANIELDEAYAEIHEDARPGPHVMIAVADTGTGMSEEVRSQAIEPFFTTKQEGHGTGLGLSHVYGFVRQSGGHLNIYSEVGIGTTVKLFLPRYDGDEELPAQPQPSTGVPKGSLADTILVVEDDENVRAYTTTSLRELGYSVLEACDAKEALEVVRRKPDIDLLLTDLGLPGEIDGRSLAEQIGRARPALKVLLTTAYAGSALVHEGRLDAGVDLLPKPFTFAALGQKVREVLDRAEAPPSVLVVDDEVLIRMLVADTLADAGFNVEEAGTADEALNALEASGEELKAVVLDVGLPDARGDELIGRIRAFRGDMPIILATGYGDSGLPQEFANDPLLRVLTKPFQPEELSALLEQWGIKAIAR
jgi:signal transduction histidine kinase/CheY-like chemotaxis protein